MKAYILISTLVLSTNVIANQNEQVENPHSVFVAIGFGDTELNNKNNSNKSYDFDSNASSQIGYRYQINDIFSVETRYINSSSIGFKQVVSLGLLDGSIDYNTFAFSGQARKSLTQNSYIYGSVGFANYDWEYKTKESKVNDSGFASLYSLGYRYQWSKVELAIEHQWLDMGDIKATNFSTEVGYRF